MVVLFLGARDSVLRHFVISRGLSVHRHPLLARAFRRIGRVTPTRRSGFSFRKRAIASAIGQSGGTSARIHLSAARAIASLKLATRTSSSRGTGTLATVPDL